eukprot:6173289-Pleurochrysis_carterae.AAC.1
METTGSPGAMRLRVVRVFSGKRVGGACVGACARGHEGASAWVCASLSARVSMRGPEYTRVVQGREGRSTSGREGVCARARSLCGAQETASDLGDRVGGGLEPGVGLALELETDRAVDPALVRVWQTDATRRRARGVHAALVRRVSGRVLARGHAC